MIGCHTKQKPDAYGVETLVFQDRLSDMYQF